MYEFLRKSRK